jgi:hypothetical protein
MVLAPFLELSEASSHTLSENWMELQDGQDGKIVFEEFMFDIH